MTHISLNSERLRSWLGTEKMDLRLKFETRSYVLYIDSVASIPIPGKRSLRPVKNKGSFDKVVDQNFFPIFTFSLFFTGQTTSLTKLSP